MKITYRFIFSDDSSASKKLEQLLNKILKGNSIMAATLDSIIDKVSAQTTQLDSLNTFVEGLQQQIKDLKLNPADQAKIDTLFTKVSDNDQKIADAFTENVPPAPEPTPVPEPVPPVPPVNPVNQV